MTGRRARGRGARAAVVAAALAGALVLGGCGGLPRSGPVLSGSRVVDDPRAGVLQVIPRGPRVGAGPAEVVRGFLLAGGAAADDFAVARSFLTGDAAGRWRPAAGTTLLRDAADVTPAPVDAAEAAQVAVTGEVLAVVDAAGHYEQRPGGTRASLAFRLVQADGEWRIDELPDGLVLTRVDASRSLRPFPVYFATADGRQLVGDVRWFPYDSTTPTRIVAELLAGPSPWLAPAVRSGAPEGTALRVGTVPVEAGTATVELTSAVLEADPERRTLLLAQLRASLTRLPSVGRVRVVVDGAELSRGAPGDGTGPVVADGAPDARPVLLGPGGLSRWDGTSVRAVPGTGPGLSSAEDAAHPAVSPDGEAYAVLLDGERELAVQRPGGPLRVVHRSAVPLSPPSVDRSGWVWTVPAEEDAEPVVVAVDAPDEPPVRVQLPAAGMGGVVQRWRVSRDGARALVVVRAPDGSQQVRVHGLVRDRDGRPLRVGDGSAPLVPGAEEVLDVSWPVDDQVVLLVRLASEPDPVPVLSGVSGPWQALPAVPGAVSVAAGTSERDVVVATADGRLLARSGAEWLVFAQGRDPAYPG
ncbi:LpqB family beta-propeller domain-containing protein [Kineococcus terrestris]|uniref:LpqB family beta-propeller domain-containing protein n=1 Tax=Kineococcus terrestris TaxID=2044856 RepID=UPI0034DB1B2F